MLHARCTPHRRVSPRMPAVAASAAAAPLASPVQAAAPVSPAVFEFASAGKIVFGRGTVSRVPSLVAELGGTRVLVVVGQSPSRAAPLVAALRSAGLEATVFCCGGGEPTLDSAAAGVAAGRAAKADLVVGFGGGTAVDLGKAVAALLTQPGVLLDYMEVVGRGQPITARPLPFIAVPTTAGTGSEVTRNAVLDSPEAGVKASLRHAWMLPSVAVVDPELTVGVPRAVTAATGLDALTQCIEPHVCCSPNFLVDAISMEGVRRAARSLERACADGRDMDAREDMCVAAVCGGLSLANAKLGSVHGFAGPLGGMLHAPHGALCAALLPACCEVNVAALRASGDAAKLRRYEDVARALTGDAAATPEDGVAWLRGVCARLGVVGLGAHGMTAERFGEAIEKGSKSSSMKGNPVPLSRAQMEACLAGSM